MENPVLKNIEDQYEILDKLGEGGMGVVYKVRHRLLEELRVVKVMRRALEADEELGARFLREARIAVRLKHPNIAQLYDFALDEDGTAFIVMEFLEGVTLRELMDSTGPPPLASSLEIARQSLEALGYLHHQGFVHRDVSPDNLMVTTDVDGDSLVKLIDLGLAKGLGGGTTVEQMTMPGMFMGKLRYSSPEQFGPEGAAAVDARSDLYAFGIVLYELLTGQFPIAGRSPPAIMTGHLKDPPLDFRSSDPVGRVPDELRKIVLKALAKKPEKRFADAEEFSGALSSVEPQAAAVSGGVAEEDRGRDALTATATLVLHPREKKSALEPRDERARPAVPPSPGPGTPVGEDLPTMALPRTTAPSPPAKPPAEYAAAPEPAGRPGRRQRLQGPRVAAKMPGGRELPGDVTVRLPKAAKTGTEHQPAAVPSRPVAPVRRREAEERTAEIAPAAAAVDRVPSEPPAARPLREAVSPPPAWDQAMLRPESPEQVPRSFAVAEPADEARPTTAPRRPMLGVIAAAVVALVALVALWIWWPQPSPVVEDVEELTQALETGDIASLRLASTKLSLRDVSELRSSPKAAEALRRAEGILDLYDRMWRADRNKKHDEVIRLADELKELYPAFSEPEEYRRRAVAALAGERESEQAPAQEAEGLPEEALAEETEGGPEELAAAEAAPEEPVREPERVPREELAGPASEKPTPDPNRALDTGDVEPLREESAAVAQDADAAPRGDPRMDRVLADVARAEAGRRPAEGLMILSSVKPTA
ncbi:MAG: protein kinase, partial [bacterium]|nr:protein kinase [bacterium]